MKKLPAGWIWEKLCNVVEHSQYGVSTASILGGRIPMLRMNNIADGKLNLKDLVTINISDADLKTYRLRDGDLLFNRTNSADLVGKTALFTESRDFVCASYLVRFRLLRDRVDPQFVCFVFNSQDSQRTFHQLATKAVAQVNINPTSLQQKFQFPVPPLAEQESIAKILLYWDGAIFKREAVLAAKVERKCWLMQQLLTGKKRFKEFKGERWQTFKLGDLLREVDRYVTFDDEHTYKLASIRRRSEGFFFRESLQGNQIKTKVMKTICTGDFVLSKMQVVHGAWGLVTPEFNGMFVSDSYIALVPVDPKKLKIEFLNYLSQTRYLRHLAYLACHGVHIEKMTFHLDDFFDEKIKIPSSIEEQDKIVSVLETCDNEINLLKKQLDALKEQKRGLMQKLLTGEIRVKV